MGRTPPAPRARRRRIEQSPRWQSPSTRVALNATGTNVEIHTTPTKREPEDGPKSSFHLRPPVGSAMSAWGQSRRFGRSSAISGILLTADIGTNAGFRRRGPTTDSSNLFGKCLKHPPGIQILDIIEVDQISATIAPDCPKLRGLAVGPTPCQRIQKLTQSPEPMPHFGLVDLS